MEELKKRKIPIVEINKSLNKYDNIVLFPNKLEKANEMHKKVEIPKQCTTPGSTTVNGGIFAIRRVSSFVHNFIASVIKFSVSKLMLKSQPIAKKKN